MIKFSSFVTEASTSDLLPQTVIVAIKASGGKIFQIGGAVRDEILGTANFCTSNSSKSIIMMKKHH